MIDVLLCNKGTCCDLVCFEWRSIHLLYKWCLGKKWRLMFGVLFVVRVLGFIRTV
jgi:hypothetical protein